MQQKKLKFYKKEIKDSLKIKNIDLITITFVKN